MLYNLNLSDILVKFCIKARLNILPLLPTEYTKHLWNEENDPLRKLCKLKWEYMSHVLNGCKMLNNFYNRRHDRIVDKLADELKMITESTRWIFVNKLFENVFPDMKEELMFIVHRKPDIVFFRNGVWYIIEITVCYDSYFEYSYAGKVERYSLLLDCLRRHGIEAKLQVLCFGSLGCIKRNVWNNLRVIGLDADSIKSFLSWASISCVIGANYVWRHRVKKIFDN